ncbi:MAG TPA: hypothetical protein VD771_09270 [Gemmatimonadaceae bacterium]|nr:hypothetical protein [Gemmatimonadaceae bacterium]
MRRRLVSVSTVALAFIAVFAPPAIAQRVLGVGDDALVLPRGVLRFRILGNWTGFNERYGRDTPGRPDGALEPLGIDFTLDTVGVKQFPNLARLQTGLQSLTGNPTWYGTLGNTQVTLRDRVSAYPFVLEAGLSKRVSVGVQVPYVVTNTNTFFNVNTSGTQGNLGFNPAAGGIAPAIAQNSAMYTQFTTAAATLEGSIAACKANPGVSPSCPTLLANEASANSLIASSRAFAGGAVGPVGGPYNPAGGIYTTSPFVPILGTDAQLAIEARVQAFKALYSQFLGAGNPITTNGPFASQNRLTVSDAQRILTESAFGIQADPLTTTGHSHVGDIDVGAKLLVYDSFDASTEARMSPKGLNFRTSVGGMFRIPTGQIESPNNFVDIGTGRGAKAIEGRWFGDILIGSHLWQSFVVRYNKPFADDQEMRIIDLPNQELAPAYRRQMVHRELGSTFEFETTPRIVLNDFFAISGQYVYRHKNQDHYTGTFTIPVAITGFADLNLDASTLNLETETREHRLGGGISFSNLYSFEQGKAKVPFEVTYLHWQTVKGSGGNQPKFFTDQIQLRLYARIFGGM